MFWNSVRTHKPSTSGVYIVYDEKSGFTRRADVDHLNDGSYRFIDHFDNEIIKDVSHFADIPSIPIT